MTTPDVERVYRLAPMAGIIRWLTWVLLTAPVALMVGALAVPPFALISLFMVALYAAVWLVARPRRFVLSGTTLKLVFPVWRRTIPLADAISVRTMSARDFRSRYGIGLRVGAGGLWGGFGWLLTTRAGIMEFYISRTDGLLVIERRVGRPLLITPERPGEMAAEVERRLQKG